VVELIIPREFSTSRILSPLKSASEMPLVISKVQLFRR